MPPSPYAQAPADLRLAAAQIADEMREALRCHGWALIIRPAPPVGCTPYIHFSSPLPEDVARRIVAGLQRLQDGESA